MEELFKLGIDEDSLVSMIEQCPNIRNMDNNDILEMIDLLKYIDCTDSQIRNIIICNPYYLDRFINDIYKLINCFKGIGISELNLLFDANPYLLNKDEFEVKEYINNRLSVGIKIDDIIDEIECNPYVID